MTHVDDRRLAYVRDLLQAAGASRAVATHRSALLYRTLIAEFTWRSHGGPAITPRALDQLHRMLLLADGSPAPAVSQDRRPATAGD